MGFRGFDKLLRVGALVTCVLVPLPSLSAGPPRVWTDAIGKFRVEASLISSDEANATLETPEGRSIVVPVARLCEADRLYLATSQRRENPPEGAASPASLSELRNYERIARSAKQVLAVYSEFIGDSRVPEEDRKTAAKDLSTWEQRANRDCVRIGRDWLSPGELEQARIDEIRLLKEAHRLIEVGNNRVALAKFKEASDVNPNSIRADFYLGLLNLLLPPQSPVEAQKCFRECTKRLYFDEELLVGARKANYAASLNNLAVAEVRLRQYDQAIQHWRQAIEILPAMPELVQNLGRLSGSSRDGIKMPSNVADRAAELYAAVSVANESRTFDNSRGWLIVPLIDTEDGSLDGGGDSELVTMGWFTAFAVDSEHLLTTRAAIVDADRYRINAGDGRALPIQEGKLVAFDPGSDVVLLRFAGLGAKPLEFSAEYASQAHDYTIAGYSEPGFAGGGLQTKTTSVLSSQRVVATVDLQDKVEIQQVDSISATVSASDVQLSSFSVSGIAASFNLSFQDKLIHDAVINGGFRGSPLLDAENRVVGVHLGSRAGLGYRNSSHSYAQTGADAARFVRSCLRTPGERVASQRFEPGGEAVQGEGLGNSIFMIASVKASPRLSWSHRIKALHQHGADGEWTSFEDSSCIRCNGLKRMECPNRDCARGRVREYVVERVTFPVGQYSNQQKQIRVTCPTCRGRGYLPCNACR